MKQFLIFAIFLTIGVQSYAQNHNDAVQWSYEYERSGENEYLLRVKATIKEGWHLYARDFDQGGPIPLEITFKENEGVQFLGETKSLHQPVSEVDEIFGITVKYYDKDVVFEQKIKLKTNQAVQINFSAEGQVCENKSGMCILTDSEYVFDLNK
ncbi:MAG: protein-disulfide reductase DsbD family protein [Bacteroidota bacterium]|nr:protein-disulfide reductase DsbD family protein [Bacteroidota bacterium]